MNDFKEISQMIDKFELIGPRPIGSKNLNKAANYIKEYFEVIGLKTELQEFNCTFWNLKSVFLEINNQELNAKVNIYSPKCDIEANFISIKNLEELKKLDKNEASNNVVVLYGDLTKDKFLFPQNYPFFNIEEHQKTYKW